VVASSLTELDSSLQGWRNRLHPSGRHFQRRRDRPAKAIATCLCHIESPGRQCFKIRPDGPRASNRVPIARTRHALWAPTASIARRSFRLARQWQAARSENIEISREAPDAAALDMTPRRLLPPPAPLPAPGMPPIPAHDAGAAARGCSGAKMANGIAADKLKANSADRRPGVRISTRRLLTGLARRTNCPCLLYGRCHRCAFKAPHQGDGGALAWSP
jgi:hypothetical protein